MTKLSVTGARYGEFDADDSFWVTAEGKPRREDGSPGPDGVQVLELPYKGEKVSMVIMLPRTTEELPELERKLSPMLLTSCLRQLETKEVRVVLPRFTSQTRYTLNSILQALGMRTAFQRCGDTAGGGDDFTGLYDPRPGLEPLYVNLVVHEATVDVNERGTVAAAATGMTLDLLSEPPAPIPVFRADRPFMYVIYHRETDTALFLGRMMRPDPA